MISVIIKHDCNQFNDSQELYTAFKSLIFPIKDFRLTGEEADRFDELPGFIR
jgi:hypothetical protein